MGNVSLSQVVLLAVLVESLVNTLKLVYEQEKRKVNVDVILAIAVGQLIAFSVGLDLLELFGFPTTIPYVGTVATGVVISRGATFVNDLFKLIQGFSTK